MHVGGCGGEFRVWWRLAGGGEFTVKCQHSKLFSRCVLGHVVLLVPVLLASVLRTLALLALVLLTLVLLVLSCSWCSRCAMHLVLCTLCSAPYAVKPCAVHLVRTPCGAACTMPIVLCHHVPYSLLFAACAYVVHLVLVCCQRWLTRRG